VNGLAIDGLMKIKAISAYSLMRKAFGANKVSKYIVQRYQYVMEGLETNSRTLPTEFSELYDQKTLGMLMRVTDDEHYFN